MRVHPAGTNEEAAVVRVSLSVAVHETREQENHSFTVVIRVSLQMHRVSCT